MTAAASLVLSVLQAHPGSPVWRIAAEAGIPVNVAAIALRQLAASGLAVRGEDAFAIVIWTATDGGAA